MRNKKGAMMSLSDAPTIVLLVGLTFLVMATIAFIAFKYGAAMPADLQVSVANETGAYINQTGYTLAGASATRANNFVITQVRNASDQAVITSGNYTVSSTGVLTNATATNWASVHLSYTYDKQSVAGDVTDNLSTEIANNTSIAGIVLTISLVGIVLTVLIGIFMITRATRTAGA